MRIRANISRIQPARGGPARQRFCCEASTQRALVRREAPDQVRVHVDDERTRAPVFLVRLSSDRQAETINHKDGQSILDAERTGRETVRRAAADPVEMEFESEILTSRFAFSTTIAININTEVGSTDAGGRDGELSVQSRRCRFDDVRVEIDPPAGSHRVLHGG